MRLNLSDYESVPLQFKDFTIQDGRATFRVPGEFEIDLTIADENPDSQYWFIDLRFLFGPSLSVLTPRVRFHIEEKVNEALLKDGLSGCYRFLHEMVLTHKISEFRRQAFDLSQGKWIETLKVEALNRAISIQYWLDRFLNATKSWVILGVHSGKRKDGRPDPKATSRLSIRWFREGKEVKDVDIPFDTVNISTESLLRTVVAKHADHILTSMHGNLQALSLYAKRDLAIALVASSAQQTQTSLNVQLTNRHHVTIDIEPITGLFIFNPASRAILEVEHRLNEGSAQPAVDGHLYIEQLRFALLSEDIVGRGMTVGWIRTNLQGLSRDSVASHVPKDTKSFLWFRRAGWVKDWYLLVSLSMSGEHWLLLET